MSTGTKNNPSKYDCYMAAGPDEPIFVLLARDPLAPILVELWASLRAEYGCSEHPNRSHNDKSVEANKVAMSMRVWRASREEEQNGE